MRDFLRRAFLSPSAATGAVFFDVFFAALEPSVVFAGALDAVEAGAFPAVEAGSEVRRVRIGPTESQSNQPHSLGAMDAVAVE